VQGSLLCPRPPTAHLDAKFLDLAKRSGLLHVNMGIESISQNTLQTMHKEFNRSHSYDEMIGNLNRRNISYSFNFVFGTDTDEPDIFPATLAFLRQHKVPAAYFNLMVPLRGMPLYDRVKTEDRVIDEPNMERWAGVRCHYPPTRMSGDELVDQVKKLQRDFYFAALDSGASAESAHAGRSGVVERQSDPEKSGAPFGHHERVQRILKPSPVRPGPKSRASRTTHKARLNGTHGSSLPCVAGDAALMPVRGKRSRDPTLGCNPRQPGSIQFGGSARSVLMIGRLRFKEAGRIAPSHPFQSCRRSQAREIMNGGGLTVLGSLVGTPHRDATSRLAASLTMGQGGKVVKVGEVVSDMANKLIAQVEDGADGPAVERTTHAIVAEWRSGIEDGQALARLLRKLTDNLLEQREAYSRRASKRSRSANQPAADRLRHWAETINAAIQTLRDERAELKAQRPGAVVDVRRPQPTAQAAAQR
jgi:hypothetical protein